MGDGVLVFPFLWITGKSIAFHCIPALPTIDPPLSELLIFFLGGHHGDILGDADFVAAVIGADAMGLEAIEYQKISGCHFHFDLFKACRVRFKMIAIGGLG